MKLTHVRLRIIPAIALGLFAASAVALAATPAALAQTAAPAANPATQDTGPDPYVEGQIAFMKAALDITPAQEAQWNKVAAAMRENNRETQQLYAKQQAAETKTENAVQRIETQIQSAELSAKEGKRFLDVFRPLYASLSKDQKSTADDLMGQQTTASTATPPPPNEPPPAAPAK